MNGPQATTEELLSAILVRLRAIHLAIVDPARARRDFELEMEAVERRMAEAKAEGQPAKTNGAGSHLRPV